MTKVVHEEFGLPPADEIKPAASIHEALSRLQAEVRAAAKDSMNLHFKSQYADLAAVWEACRAPLVRHGLSVVQTTDFDKDDVWLVTTLWHCSGQSISGRYPLRPVKNDPQGYGSALTYARRYTLAAMVGVVADEDDDGNRASTRGNGNRHESYGKITPEQTQTIRDMLASSKGDPQKFCEYFHIGALPELSATDFRHAVEMLNTKLHPKGAPRPSQHEH
ncbi:MAG TPA: ERF family protein [Terriglobales bacterium]